MKNQLNFFFKTLSRIAAVSLVLIGCETTELNLQDSPNAVTPASADPQLLLNNIQHNFVSALAYNEDNEDGLNVRAAEFVRMQHLFGAYAGPFSLTSGKLDDIWTAMYRETLRDISILIPLSEERNLKGYTAVAKIIRSWAYVYLVDAFGAVPFSEALKGNENPNPKADDGQSIYNEVLVELDSAITLLKESNVVMPNDLIYQGNADKWLKSARTLKLKMYVHMRLLGDYKNEINTLISEGLIESKSEDFELKYSTVDDATGDSRHPYYALNYDSDGADDYLNSHYVNLLLKSKGFKDPRLRYYFYRQTTETPTGDNLKCDGKSQYTYCYLGDLYWTRDHGDDDGVPPDQLLRSTYGLYPIGGAFDDDSFESVDTNSGAGGAGIFPMMTSFYVDFLLAESALMTGTNGDPKALLEEAIRGSFDKVLNFIPSQVDASFASTPTEVNDYITHVMSAYDAAADNNAKLDIIMQEYFIALWGNGIEAWNNYRRTSMPSDLSNHVATSGDFPRSLLYPAAVVNTNSNISQKKVSTKVFWDKNTDTLD